MTETPKAPWNFNIQLIMVGDRRQCVFFVDDGGMHLPKDDLCAIDLEDAREGIMHLVELAALFALGRLHGPDPIFEEAGIILDAEGDFPESFNPDAYDGENRSGFGINIYETYLYYGLKALAPILVKYPFNQ